MVHPIWKGGCVTGRRPKAMPQRGASVWMERSGWRRTREKKTEKQEHEALKGRSKAERDENGTSGRHGEARDEGKERISECT